MTAAAAIDPDFPIAATLFADMKDFFGTGPKKQNKHDGILKETVELFIEQFSTNIIGYKILGIGRGARESLERFLRDGSSTNAVGDVAGACVDLCKELNAQSYVPVGGLLAEYVIPWLEAVTEWLVAEHSGSPALADARICVELLHTTAGV